jgi:hypothetical protein
MVGKVALGVLGVRWGWGGGVGGSVCVSVCKCYLYVVYSDAMAY